jgi:1-acyl-sn-glycerol-3-phosphate acyltransferase
MMIFPEGTRSPDGCLQPFKTGAFHLALNTRLPILPIVIDGTSRAIRKGGFLISRNHSIRVRILDPVRYETFKSMDAKSLARDIQQRIGFCIEPH